MIKIAASKQVELLYLGNPMQKELKAHNCLLLHKITRGTDP